MRVEPFADFFLIIFSSKITLLRNHKGDSTTMITYSAIRVEFMMFSLDDKKYKKKKKMARRKGVFLHNKNKIK